MAKKQDTEYKYWCKFQEENCSYCWGTVFNSTPQEFKNKYNAVCYIEDVDKAVGVGVFLRTLGYKVQNMHHPRIFYGVCSLNHTLYVDEFGISYNGADRENPLEFITKWVSDRNKERAEGKEFHYQNEFIDCGDNVELLKTVASLTDTNDLNQPFIRRLPNGEEDWYINTQWKHFETDCNVEWAKKACRKATLDEIINHFKNNGKY